MSEYSNGIKIQSRINYCTAKHSQGNIISYSIIENATSHISISEVKECLEKYSESIKNLFGEILPNINYKGYTISTINNNNWLSIDYNSKSSLTENEKRKLLQSAKNIFNNGLLSHIPVKYMNNSNRSVGKNPNQIYYIKFDTRLMQLTTSS